MNLFFLLLSCCYLPYLFQLQKTPLTDRLHKLLYQSLLPESLPGLLVTKISTASPPKSQPGLDTKISTRTPHPPKSLPRLHHLPRHQPGLHPHQNLYQDSTPCLAIKISTRTPPPASPSKSLPGLHPLPRHQNLPGLHPLPRHQNLYQDSTPCLAVKISTRTPPPASPSKSLLGLHPLPRHQNLYQDSTPFFAIKITTRTLPLLKGGAHQQKRMSE